MCLTSDRLAYIKNKWLPTTEGEGDNYELQTVSTYVPTDVFAEYEVSLKELPFVSVYACYMREKYRAGAGQSLPLHFLQTDKDKAIFNHRTLLKLSTKSGS